MNEPHDMPTELWRDDANRAIRAIRQDEAQNLILVPGNAWTGGWSWEQHWCREIWNSRADSTIQID